MIIVFASIYYITFMLNTASFYISDEYNENANDICYTNEREDLYTIYDNEHNPFSIKDFNQKIKPINDSLIQVFDSIASVLTSNSLLECKNDSLFSLFDSSRVCEIDCFRELKLKNISDSILDFEDSIKDSLHMGVDEKELIINGAYIYLSQLKLRKAILESNVADYIITHYSNFGDSILIDSIECVKEMIVMNNKQLNILESDKHRLFNNYNNAKYKLHKQRLGKVNYWDFLHFSVLIATSNSFGDMLPNTRLVRFIVSIQLIIGIIYLALILNGIIIKKDINT